VDNSESGWSPLLDRPPTVPPPGPADHLMVVAAHPGDETLGAGGLIASAAAAGADVTVVIATDGDTTNPVYGDLSPDALASLRRREVYAAVSALAPRAQVQLLGLPVSRVGESADELAATLERLGATCTYVASTWSGDRHPDYEACARAAGDLSRRTGARHWQFPIRAWAWMQPDRGDRQADQGDLPAGQLRGVRLDHGARQAKAAAIECHVSQHQPLPGGGTDEPILDATMLEHFRRDTEIFVVESAGEVVSRDYFDDLYSREDDPWKLNERFYEQRKRAAILAALTKPRFRRAFEPGCATGLLTADLAGRSDEVVAWDIAGAAVERAADRLRDLAHVEVGVGAIPEQWPGGRFDLIVLSEVGYYCTDLDALVQRIEESLDDEGVLVACHWRRSAPMNPHSAGAVHAAIGTGRHLVVSHVEDDFLLQLWTRSGVSVAAAEGIVS
jgi:LmbE family N-acetylglucosaminyl deacetylase/SAM-dependent methyltransferase